MKKNQHIITKSAPAVEHIAWNKEIAQAFRNSKDLLDFLHIDASANPRLKNQFSCLVPRHFAELMQKGNAKDPLLLQVLPQDKENFVASEFSQNPVADTSFNPVPSIIHKYKNRCLIIANPACAVHCRYCFRKFFPYADNFLHKGQIQEVLNYINQNSNIHEVILSGGDPLMNKDAKLAELITALSSLANVKRLRIHTRLPVVIPNRIDDKLISWIKNSRLQIIFVLHINHPNEISSQLVDKVAILKNNGVLVLNQSVFLKNINDNLEVLTDLSEALFAAGILPYYLNLLDKVQGSEHFFVPDKKAIQIYSQLAKNLSGFMLPKLVRDLGDNSFKQIIAPIK